MTTPAEGTGGVGPAGSRGFSPGERPPPDWRREELAWRQTGSLWSPSWQLEAGGECVASYAREGWARSRAVAETAAGRWTIRARGLFGREITREGDSGPAARYAAGWFLRGRIATASGAGYRVRHAFFGGTLSLCNDEGFPFLHVVAGPDPFKTEGSVRFEEAGRRLEHPEPLVLLLWDLVVEARRSHAASGGH